MSVYLDLTGDSLTAEVVEIPDAQDIPAYVWLNGRGLSVSLPLELAREIGAAVSTYDQSVQHDAAEESVEGHA